MTRAAAVALLAALVPASLEAQDRWETQVRNQMHDITYRAESAGFSRTSQYYYGQLRHGQSETINLSFAAGREYLVIAACDSDCPDIDLRLYEDDGELVGSDLRSDAFPIVTVPTGHTGTHPVKVSMARCDANPCRYEIAVFSR